MPIGAVLAVHRLFSLSQCSWSVATRIARPGPHSTCHQSRSLASLSNKRRRASRYTTAISTLDPTKLMPADRLTFNPCPPHRVNVYSRHSPGRIQLIPLDYGDPVFDTPADFSGFLYYHAPFRGPPLAGELRLRITPSRDPESFPSGVDHTSQRGVLWRIGLPSIAKAERFVAIRHLLIHVDGLVPQETMDLAQRQTCVRTISGATRTARWIYSFGQPFDLPLDNFKHAFVFVGKSGIERAILPTIAQFRSGYAGIHTLQSHNPFLGTAICCFEPSPLPEHGGRRMVVIRVLRSLESDPIRPNPLYSGPGYPPGLIPQAGELLMTCRIRELRPWVGDVDSTSERNNPAASLGVLFDNALEYNYP